MREAALMIAAARDDFAPSLLARVCAGLRSLASGLVRRRRAQRYLAWLHTLDAHMLDDLGLVPADLAHLDPAIDAREAVQRLHTLADHRRNAWPRQRGWNQDTP